MECAHQVCKVSRLLHPFINSTIYAGTFRGSFYTSESQPSIEPTASTNHSEVLMSAPPDRTSKCSRNHAASISCPIYKPHVGMDSPDTFPPSVMPPNSPAGRLLEYTVVAANALQDVAGATHIPFLSKVSTLTLAIIPMVQVRNSHIPCPVV